MGPRAAVALSALATTLSCASGSEVVASTAPTPEGVVFMRSSKRYEVDASSSQALARSISEERRKQDQRRWLGMTTWRTRWSYVTVAGIDGCSLSNIRLTVATQVSLPRWTVPAGLSPQRREWWNRIEFAITQHEKRHVEIAEAGGVDIARAIAAQDADDCAALRAQVERVAKAGVDRVRARQQSFDASTEGQLMITAPPP